MQEVCTKVSAKLCSYRLVTAPDPQADLVCREEALMVWEQHFALQQQRAALEQWKLDALTVSAAVAQQPAESPSEQQHEQDC